jgi:hypothetical protein
VGGGARRKSRWVWQAVGVLCLPVTLIYSGLYFTRIRPRPLAAERSLWPLSHDEAVLAEHNPDSRTTSPVAAAGSPTVKHSQA